MLGLKLNHVSKRGHSNNNFDFKYILIVDVLLPLQVATPYTQVHLLPTEIILDAWISNYIQRFI